MRLANAIPEDKLDKGFRLYEGMKDVVSLSDRIVEVKGEYH